VEILFQGRKLEKLCTDPSQRARTYGSICAKLLRQRLDDFAGAENLEGMHLLSQAKCHELAGDRKGTLAVVLKQPYRLIFEPANDPVPRKPDGGLDWTQVTAIRILGVENYHD